MQGSKEEDEKEEDENKESEGKEKCVIELERTISRKCGDEGI